jgi:hypothetical protein
LSFYILLIISAHGLAGILQVLLGFQEYLDENPEAEKLVKKSIDHVLSIQQSNGNFGTRVNHNETSKLLVHWCHGAGGDKLINQHKFFIILILNANKLM